MARKSAEEVKQSKFESVDSVHDMNDQPPSQLADVAPVIASAVKKEEKFSFISKPAEAPPKVKQWKVTKGGMVMGTGGVGRTALKPGKIVDQLNFDIEALKLQGVEFEEV